MIVIHAGAGPSSAARAALAQRSHAALLTALGRAQAVLAQGGGALDAVQVAVTFMEDEADFFNAGRGSVLCADATTEMSAAVMRGCDRAAGAVAILRRTRLPIVAARVVLQQTPHVLLVGEAADRCAARHGAEQRDPGYFVTDHQRGRLRDAGSDFERGTVGAVCLDADGALAAGTSTGGRRGQLPGRVGDTPLIGAGTWADEQVAVSCTGDGEAFIRAAAAHQLASRVRGGEALDGAAESVLRDVGGLDGLGGLIAVDVRGEVAMQFTAGAMNRGVWRPGAPPTAWV